MQRDGKGALPHETSTVHRISRKRISDPFKAIGWAFLGIRGSDARQRDAAQVSPLVWIATGIAAAVVLVVVLMVVVHWLVPAVG